MDEKSLAVAYNISKRSKKGALTHEPKADDFSPRKERLKAMLMSQGGEVQAQDAHEESYNLDELFPETDAVEDAPDIEVSPEDKRKERLKGILSNFEMVSKQK